MVLDQEAWDAELETWFGLRTIISMVEMTS